MYIYIPIAIYSSIYVTGFAKTLQLHTSDFQSLTLHNSSIQLIIHLKISPKAKVTLLYIISKFQIIPALVFKLWIAKGAKLNVCNWRVFANPVTILLYW